MAACSGDSDIAWITKGLCHGSPRSRGPRRPRHYGLGHSRTRVRMSSGHTESNGMMMLNRAGIPVSGSGLSERPSRSFGPEGQTAGGVKKEIVIHCSSFVQRTYTQTCARISGYLPDKLHSCYVTIGLMLAIDFLSAVCTHQQRAFYRR